MEILNFLVLATTFLLGMCIMHFLTLQYPRRFRVGSFAEEVLILGGTYFLLRAFLRPKAKIKLIEKNQVKKWNRTTKRQKKQKKK